MILRQPTNARCQFRQDYLIDEARDCIIVRNVPKASSIIDDAFLLSFGRAWQMIQRMGYMYIC